jgi:hypothetical protein
MGLSGTNTDPMTTLYMVITRQQAVDQGLVRVPFWGGP